MAEEENVENRNTCSNSTSEKITDMTNNEIVTTGLDIIGISNVEQKPDVMSTNISFKIPGLPGKIQSQQNKSKKYPDDVQQTPEVTKSEINNDGDEKIYKNLEDEVQTEKVKNITPDTKGIKYNKLSPTEQLKQSQVLIPYKEPSWSGTPDDNYSFDVLKNGVIIESIKLEKPYYVFGRLPSCDVTMDHPSLSRYHAVVQFCKVPKEGKEKGWYLYDLDSTHGTWINKNKTFSQKYYRIRVGHMLKFGGSTRIHILQGPQSDEEEESDLSVSELKEQREKQKKEAEILQLADLAEEERKLEAMKRKHEETGCSWGIGEDAEEEAEESAFSEIITPDMEALYIDDPKKALKGYFEREGYEAPEYEVDEAGRGKYKCTVELPVDTPTGEPMKAEAVVSGKKKDAVVQCALEACRLLDKQGLLRASKHESHKRKKKNWEEDDFYDSDEDLYLDRTGNIEKKRQQRMKKAGKMQSHTETYNSLVEKHSKILAEIQEIETKLEKAKEDAAAMQDDNVDALDAYMLAIKSGMMDTKAKMKLKRQLLELKQEEGKVRRLVNIAKPASLPELKCPEPSAPKKTEIPKALPVVGKLKSLTAHKIPKKPINMPLKKIEESPYEDKFQVEEEEDDEEEEEKNHSKIEQHTKSYQESAKNENKTDQDIVKKPELRSSDRDTLMAKGPSHPRNKNENSETFDTGMCKNMLIQTPSENMGSAEDNQNKTKQTIDSSSRKRHHQVKSEKNSKKQKTFTAYDDSDPDYAVWMPPTNQSGDGKTHLNEKYGY